MAATYEVDEIQVIELHMVDKKKYFPLTMLSGFSIRGLLYPFSLIKTRLQVQKNSEQMYRGTFDAFKKISSTEGFRGLYRGFWISNCLIVSQMSYITTYEGVRHYLKNYTEVKDNRLRSFIAGGCASMVGQTTMVPIDIVSQHLQMLGVSNSSGKSQMGSSSMKPLYIPPESARTKLGAAKAIVLAVYKRDGIRGFYKGYLASLSVYAPNSAMWWFFYDIYCGKFIVIRGTSLIWTCFSDPSNSS